MTPASKARSKRAGGISHLAAQVQYATPIWPEAEAEAYADGVLRTLELAARQAPAEA